MKGCYMYPAKSVLKFLFAIIIFMFTNPVFSEPANTNSKLPACNTWSFLRWDDCFGTRKYDRARTTYTGEFRKGYANGKGKLVYENGYSYEGEFEDGLPNGHGIDYRADGVKYFEGSYSKELRHGIGTFYFAKDDKYGRETVRGDFNSGSLPSGRILYKNGELFDGELDENFMPFGHGVITSADRKDKKEGFFKDGILQSSVQSKAELVAQDYPFYAEIRCIAPDNSYAPPISCFYNGNTGIFIVRNGQNSTEYGVVTQKDIPSKIMLEKSFSIGARNSHEALVLAIEVFDTISKKSLFYKKVGQYGVIEISN